MRYFTQHSTRASVELSIMPDRPILMNDNRTKHALKPLASAHTPRSPSPLDVIPIRKKKKKTKNTRKNKNIRTKEATTKKFKYELEIM